MIKTYIYGAERQSPEDGQSIKKMLESRNCSQAKSETEHVPM